MAFKKNNRKRCELLMMKNIKWGIYYIIMFSLSLLWLYPYFWMILASVKPADEIFTRFLPTHLSLKSYTFIMSVANEMGFPFVRGLLNSIFISITVSIIYLLNSPGLTHLSGFFNLLCHSPNDQSCYKYA